MCEGRMSVCEGEDEHVCEWEDECVGEHVLHLL